MGLTEASTVASSLPWKNVLRKTPCPRLNAVLARGLLLLCMVPTSALAQQQASARAVNDRSLPDGPLPNLDLGPNDPAWRTIPAEVSGSVVGTVLDISGASVPGAQVSLMHGDGTELHTMVSEANGEFNFTKIPPGSYLVIVNAKDFATFTSAEFVVADQQVYEVADVSLTIAAANMEVTVQPTEFIAAEQIRNAEKQRLMGVIPNFYTSYVIDAAPLTAKQKFRFAVRGTFDPVSMLGVGLGAGIEQATNAYPGYGQGAAGYAKRLAAKFADGRSSDLLTHAVFPSLFHQDPRYYYQGAGSFKSRIAHAVSSAFFARGDSGLTVPNYSYLLGDFGSAALSNLYYPKANRGASLVFTNAAVGLAGRIGGNILREFSKRLTTNLPGERIP
jgi:hypothetical protein